MKHNDYGAIKKFEIDREKLMANIFVILDQ